MIDLNVVNGPTTPVRVQDLLDYSVNGPAVSVRLRGGRQYLVSNNYAEIKRAVFDYTMRTFLEGNDE
jgi:hypothetical protein